TSSPASTASELLPYTTPPALTPRETPAWTPTGSARPAPTAGGSVPGGTGRIAFVNDTTNGWEIHVMAHDGSLRTSITSGPSDNHPSRSPDGTKIAFSRATTGSSFSIFSSRMATALE